MIFETKQIVLRDGGSVYCVPWKRQMQQICWNI